jgi:hypothetical protein
MKRNESPRKSKTAVRKAGHPREKDTLDLPEAYGETRIVLLPVGPDKIHAFWEIDPAQQGRPVLRLHETGPSPTENGTKKGAWDIPIEPRVTSRYMNLRPTGGFYQAEIGHLGQEGRFMQAALSNVIETPRAIARPPVEDIPRPEEKSLSAGSEPEAFLMKRRAAVFSHLTGTKPLPRAGSESKTDQSFQTSPSGSLPEKDLTEFCEHEFLAGISSW